MKRLMIIMSVILLITSCKKKEIEPKPVETPTIEIGTISVTAKTTCNSVSTAVLGEVLFYKTVQDRENHSIPALKLQLNGKDTTISYSGITVHDKYYVTAYLRSSCNNTPKLQYSSVTITKDNTSYIKLNY